MKAGCPDIALDVRVRSHKGQLGEHPSCQNLFWLRRSCRVQCHSTWANRRLFQHFPEFSVFT